MQLLDRLITTSCDSPAAPPAATWSHTNRLYIHLAPNQASCPSGCYMVSYQQAVRTISLQVRQAAPPDASNLVHCKAWTAGHFENEVVFETDVVEAGNNRGSSP